MYNKSFNQVLQYNYITLCYDETCENNKTVIMITFLTFLAFFFEIELIFSVICYYLVRCANIIF